MSGWVIQCTYIKMNYDSKTAGGRRKRNEIRDSGTLLTHIWGTFDTVVFTLILCACLKMACKSKTDGRRAKRGEIWELWKFG